MYTYVYIYICIHIYECAWISLRQNSSRHQSTTAEAILLPLQGVFMAQGRHLCGNPWVCTPQWTTGRTCKFITKKTAFTGRICLDQIFRDESELGRLYIYTVKVVYFDLNWNFTCFARGCFFLFLFRSATTKHYLNYKSPVFHLTKEASPVFVPNVPC